MMHDGLLGIAHDLARREEAGRPKQASLRRAISAAYAVFHALAYLWANELIGWVKPWEVVAPICRTLDHGKAKAVFKRLSDRHGANAAMISQTFILLQDRRHTADYDRSPFPFGRAETIDLVEQARQAIERIFTLTGEERLLLASQLIARTRS